jgi:hypothetical protein
MGHAWVNGYLPQPYFYDPYDLWMDWFNTGDWARDPGAYDSWGTVYAPLTFVFMKAFGFPQCYSGAGNFSAFPARTCDWLGIVTLHGFYLLNCLLVAWTYMKSDRKTALPRAFALMAGFPMTSALERGNVIVVTFACVVLAFGPLLRSARWKWIAAGLAINFKVYAVAALFPQLLRRRWRWFEGALIAAVAIYVISYGLYGQGSPAQIYKNVVGYQNVTKPSEFLNIMHAGTYGPLHNLLTHEYFPIRTLIGSKWVELGVVVLPLFQRFVQFTVVLAAAAAWLRPEAVPMYRLTNLGLSLGLITVESGAYTYMYMIFFTFLERWKGFWVKLAIVLSYLLSIQFDLALDHAPPVVRDTFFDQSTKIVRYYITLGPFVRPGLSYLIPFALACATLGAVWADIRRQGWKGRWRYRHDAPLLVGAGETKPPLPRAG